MINTPKVLTPEQEITILRAIQFENCNDSGSSRVCIDGDNECFAELESFFAALNINIHYCVVKVAVGIGGQTQMSREITAYNKYGDEYPLAAVFAYGRFIEIMEKVELVDYEYRNYYECGIFELFYYVYGGTYYNDRGEEMSWEDDDYRYTFMERYPDDANSERIRNHEMIIDTIESLTDIFGETGDNAQLGYSVIDDCIKCYDYGFVCGSSERWDSQIMNILWRDGVFVDYIDMCIDHVTASQELINSLEDKFMEDFDDRAEDEEQDTTCDEDDEDDDYECDEVCDDEDYNDFYDD